MKHLFLYFIAFLVVLITITSCGKNQQALDDNSTSLPKLKTEQSAAPSVTTQFDTFDETSESISQTQEQKTSSTASAPPITTSVTSESTIKTREQTTAATAPASDDKPEAQSKATDSTAIDVPAANALSADSVFTLPDGRTVKISDIERVLLSTNSPDEPDPEVTDIDGIIRVLSALNDMEFGEPYSGGWVGGNAIVIYSGGKSFSQISFSDDEIYLVELIAEENAKAVYPIISGGLSYEEWKALFG